MVMMIAEQNNMEQKKLTWDEIERISYQKYLGYANGWSETPQEVREANRNGYKFYQKETGRCETTYYCPEGGFYFRVDSSD